MFKPTDPQRSMFETEFVVSSAKAERLKKSWAEPFRLVVLPAIDEEIFRDAFGATGRPNKSVKVLVGLHLLKEWHDLTDAQLIEQFEFNLLWHYALGVAPEDAHVCQKTLHNFRQLLMENGRGERVFEAVTRALALADGISFGLQRMDSTHVISNIAQLRRLGLFVETVTYFLRELKREVPDRLDPLSGFRRRYLEREGYFSDATREQARRRLPVVARDVYALLQRFKDDADVQTLRSFSVLQRLFDEQCFLRDDDDPEGPAAGEPLDEDQANTGVDEGDAVSERVGLREPKEIKADSLQSPYDPDATYGHKGKGYEAQVTETCNDDNAYQLITGTALNGAHESDQRATIPMLDMLVSCDMKPEEMLADTGYGSGANLIAAAARDIELIAPVQDPYAPKPTDRFVDPGSSATTASLVVVGPTVEDLKSGLGGFTFDTTCSAVLYCPEGEEPSQQSMSGPRLEARFSAASCGGCGNADRCPTAPLKSGERRLSKTPAGVATEVRQIEQQQPPFKDRYRKRSGIESTNAELKGKHGLGSLRVRGKPRVRLALLLKALAVNAKRCVLYHVEAMRTGADATAAA